MHSPEERQDRRAVRALQGRCERLQRQRTPHIQRWGGGRRKRSERDQTKPAEREPAAAGSTHPGHACGSTTENRQKHNKSVLQQSGRLHTYLTKREGRPPSIHLSSRMWSSFDHRLSSAVVSHPLCSALRAPSPLAPILSLAGSGLLWFPLAVGALVVPVRALPSSLVCVSRSVLPALLVLDLVLVGVCKAVVRRQRPSGPLALDVLSDCYSFPSGHASRAAALAAVCCLSSSLSRAVAALAVCLALFIGLARVAKRRHYVGDVVAGFIVGAAGKGGGWGGGACSHH